MIPVNGGDRPAQRVVDRVQQVFVAEWFDNKRSRSLAEGPSARGVIGSGSYIDDRDFAIHFAQRELKVKPTHPEHADVEQNAFSVAQPARFKKGFRRPEGDASIPCRADKTADCIADGIVIVHN